MNRKLAAILTLLALLLAAPAGAETLLAGHPVTAGLAGALTRDTAVRVDMVIPPAIPMSRQASYLSGRGAPALSAAAARADAVLTLRSVWPEDPLYPLARRVAIRLVEVDAARPLDGALPGIALADGAAFPWLGPANLGRMADILAADLRRLHPEAAPAITANLARLKADLLAVSARAATAFAALPDVGVLMLSDRFATLAADLGLEVRGTLLVEDRAWTPDAIAALGRRLKAEAIPLVLHHRTPPPEVAAAIAAAGVPLVVLDSLDAGPPADVVAVLDQSVSLLAAAFGKATPDRKM